MNDAPLGVFDSGLGGLTVARALFERRLREWLATLGPPAAPDALAGLRIELAALREEAQGRGDGAALSRLDEAAQRIELWEQERLATGSRGCAAVR